MSNANNECVVILPGGFAVAFRRASNQTEQRNEEPKRLLRLAISKTRGLLERIFRPDDTVEFTIWQINHPGVSADYYRAKLPDPLTNQNGEEI